MPKTEDYISCCEWCGKDTKRFGRWELRSGAGLSIVLCTVCADWYNPEFRTVINGPDSDQNRLMEVVPCHSSDSSS